MATFAPKIDANVAYEQPQAPVVDRTGEAIVGAASSLFSTLARTQRSQAKSGPDPLVTGFMDGMRKIESQRAAGQGTRASLNERVLVQNFVAAGGELDADLKAAVEASTGRPFEYLGQTEEQRQTQAMMESEEFQVAFQSARVTLGPDASEEEITQAAMSSVAEQSVAADTIARMRSGQKVNWELQGQASFDNVISNFQKNSIGSLNMIVERGGMLTPDDVSNARKKWDMLKASALSRPPGITDDQWVSIKDKIANMDNLFTTLTQTASSEQAMEQLQSVLVQSMGPASSMSFEELLTGLTAAKSPDVLITNSGVNLAEAMSTLAGKSQANMKVSAETRLIDVATDTAPQGSLVGNTVLDPNNLPEEFAQYKGTTPEQHLADLKANNVLMSTVTPADLGKPGAAQQFAEAMQASGVVLMTSDKFVSSDMMRKIIGGNNTKMVLDQLDQMAPEDANEARILMRSGLEKQLGMLKANVGSIDRNVKDGGYDLNLVWDEQDKTYYATNEMYFKHFRQTRGTGDYNRAFVDGKGLRFGPSDHWAPKDVKDAHDRRKAIDLANRAMKDFALPEPEETVVGTQDTSVEMPSDTSTLGLIKEFEGFRTNAYWDVNAFRTGYGSDTVTKADGTIVKVTKDTVVTREDAERDLARRAQEFANTAMRQTGSKVWNEFPENVKAALTSIAYNYGSLPGRILDEVRSGDVEAIARAVEGLQNDNDGINRNRRLKEAAVIRGEGLPAAVESAIQDTGLNDDGSGGRGGQRGPRTEEGLEVMTEVPTMATPEGLSITDAVELAADQADLDRQARADEAAAETDVNRSKLQAGASKVVNAEMINAMVSSMLSAKQKRQIKAAGYNVDDVEFFESQEEAEAALAAGEVERGTLYVDKLGNVFLLE